MPPPRAYICMHPNTSHLIYSGVLQDHDLDNSLTIECDALAGPVLDLYGFTCFGQHNLDSISLLRLRVAIICPDSWDSDADSDPVSDSDPESVMATNPLGNLHSSDSAALCQRDRLTEEFRATADASALPKSKGSC